MFESLALALATGLQIWEHKAKTGFATRLTDIKRRYIEEFNKPIGVRSDAVLDHCKSELRLLSFEFAASVGQKDVAV